MGASLDPEDTSLGDEDVSAPRSSDGSKVPNFRTSGNLNASTVYTLGLVGALIFFVGRAKDPRSFAVAVLKSFVWPTLLVLGAFRALTPND